MERASSKWGVAVTVMLPTLMVIINTSIVNVCLDHIRGSFSAGLDESTWTITAYLAANAIVIPMGGWMSRYFGRKRVLYCSIIAFTVSSLLCGLAWNIESLIFFRVLQGLAGGSLQPLSQSILLETFPPAEHGTAMAIYGIGAMFGPIMGPLMGGWITDNWAWQWIFFVNVPMGAISMLMLFWFVSDPPYMKRTATSIDYWGLIFLSLWVGCLQLVLYRGQREDWFASHFITTMTVIAVFSFVFFIITEFLVDHPIVELGAFRDRSFSFGNVILFFVQAVLFGSLILLPVYLQNLMGYTAFLSGLILGPGGAAIFLVMPIVGRAITLINPKWIVTTGVVITIYSCLLMAGFNMTADFNNIIWTRIVQSVGLGLIFIPLTILSLSGIPREEMGNASSIFNLLRNLGGSFGVALATTMLTRRSQFHQNRLVDHLTPFDPGLWWSSQQTTQALQQKGMDAATAQHGGLQMIHDMLLKQAYMMSFNDVFMILAVIMAVLLPMILLLRHVKHPEAKV